MEPIIKECHDLMLSIGDLPFDKALPKMQDGLWKIAIKYKTTGDQVFIKYMDWKSSQEKKK